MARCPFAIWEPLGEPGGEYESTIYRIVHGTTETPTYEIAKLHYGSVQHVPHFTVDDCFVYQHVDTASPASALLCLTGDAGSAGAIQIEMVGFAGRPKNRTALHKVAQLCRWIENELDIPRVWPNGYPYSAYHGRDPGRHNRNPGNWASSGGHYGRCHVPGCTAWDPAYTVIESHIVMGLSAEFAAVSSVSPRDKVTLG